MMDEERREAERLADQYFEDDDLYASDRKYFIEGYAAACKAKRARSAKLIEDLHEARTHNEADAYNLMCEAIAEYEASK